MTRLRIHHKGSTSSCTYKCITANHVTHLHTSMPALFVTAPLTVFWIGLDIVLQFYSQFEVAESFIVCRIGILSKLLDHHR